MKTSRIFSTAILTLATASPLGAQSAPPAPLFPAASAPASTPAAPAPAPSTPAPAPLAAATPAPETAAQRETLGVSDVKLLPALISSAGAAGTGNALEKLSQSLDSQLIAALNATHKFQILARSDLDSILKEQSFNRSGNVDDASTNSMFRLAGAKYLLIATINDFQDRTESANFGAIADPAQRRRVSLSCVASIYATETGKLLESVKVETDDLDVRSNPKYIRESGTQWAENLPVNVAGLAAERIAREVLDLLYPAKVVAKTGNQITLNRGDGTGIAPGQTWTVFHTGAEMFDPDTHESLGKEEVPVGRALVNTVTTRTAIAELVEDHGVAIYDVARLIPGRPGPGPNPPPQPGNMPGTMPGGGPPAPMPRRQMSNPPPNPPPGYTAPLSMGPDGRVNAVPPPNPPAPQP